MNIKAKMIKDRKLRRLYLAYQKQKSGHESRWFVEPTKAKYRALGIMTLGVFGIFGNLIGPKIAAIHWIVAGITFICLMYILKTEWGLKNATV